MRLLTHGLRPQILLHQLLLLQNLHSIVVICASFFYQVDFGEGAATNYFDLFKIFGTNGGSRVHEILRTSFREKRVVSLHLLFLILRLLAFVELHVDDFEAKIIATVLGLVIIILHRVAFRIVGRPRHFGAADLMRHIPRNGSVLAATVSSFLLVVLLQILIILRCLVYCG